MSSHKLVYRVGFTLIELMIVIAIIAILATIGIPAYQNYTKKAAITELIQASANYKTEVELCVYNTGDPAQCSAGSNGIHNIAANDSFKYVQSINVDAGIIKVVGQSSLDGVNYTMTPTYTVDKPIQWQVDCGTNAQLFPANFCSL